MTAVISTGSMGLDRALGVGGYPEGRIVEIYGLESSGKTTLALHAIAECQKAGGVAAFIDAEHSFDVTYAEHIGVDINSLLIAQPTSMEDALEICGKFITDADAALVVVDSVAALVPRAKIDGETGDQHVGLRAGLMSQALRKLAPATHEAGSILVFTSRTNLVDTLGRPEGECMQALRFYAYVRLDVRRVASLEDGHRARVKVVRNRVAPPHQEAEFDVISGEGIDVFGELLDLAIESEVCQKSGSWFSYADQRLGQGKAKAVQYLRGHPFVADAVKIDVQRVWAAKKTTCS